MERSNRGKNIGLDLPGDFSYINTDPLLFVVLNINLTNWFNVYFFSH